MKSTENEEVSVIDCSIRDGGLMNKWQFPEALVRAVVEASASAGVSYIELGYKASTAYFDPREYGLWRFCRETDVRRVWGKDKIKNRSKLSVMLDIGRFHLDEMIPAQDSVVSTIRIACYTHQIDEAIHCSVFLDSLGYETFINIMAVSEADPKALEAGLHKIALNSPCVGIYVVDSYGSLNAEGARGLVSWYRTLCPGKEIGFHGHNNQQMALANTLAAQEAGAKFLDASLLGMGRGAGNCNLELLLSQLGYSLGTLHALFAAAETYLVPLQRQLRWGYSLPYALGGLANEHPRRGMAIMDKDEGILDSGYLDELSEKGMVQS